MKNVEAIEKQLGMLKEEETTLREMLDSVGCSPGKDWPLSSVIRYAQSLVSTYRKLDKDIQGDWF